MFTPIAALLIALAPQSPNPRVLFIGIDGTRPDALLKADAPNLKRLRDDGAYSFRAQTGDITVSGPGWSSMTNGVWRAKHGVRGNDFAGENLAAWPTFIARAEEAHPEWKTASFVTWKPIHKFIIRKADVRKEFKKDAEAAAAAVTELKTGDPAIVFVDLDEVDGAGHKFGFSPEVPQYQAAIHHADALVGELVAAMKSRPNSANEDWLVLVTTDHGGSGKSHGKDIPEHRTIFVIANGKGVEPGEITPPPAIVDMPATALKHLGIATDKLKLDGKPIGLKK